MSHAPIGLCLVGLGRAGHFHLRSINSTRAFNLLYVVDPVEEVRERIASEQGCKALASVEAAFADPAVEAVFVATPTAFHKDLTLRALQAGKAVLSEKPLGESIADIHECFDEAKKADKPLMVAFQRRFDPNFVAVRDAIASGRLGQLQLLRTTSRDFPRPSIAYLKQSHGIFHDMCIHDFDLLYFATGASDTPDNRPQSVFVAGSCFDPEIAALDDYDTVLITVRYANGLLATIDTARLSVYGYDQRMEAFGNGGMAVAENQRYNDTVVSTQSGHNLTPIHTSFDTRYVTAYLKEIEYFAKMVREGAPPIVTRDTVVGTALLAEAASESARTGKEVTIVYD